MQTGGRWADIWEGGLCSFRISDQRKGPLLAPAFLPTHGSVSEFLSSLLCPLILISASVQQVLNLASERQAGPELGSSLQMASMILNGKGGWEHIP